MFVISKHMSDREGLKVISDKMYMSKDIESCKHYALKFSNYVLKNVNCWEYSLF